MEVVVALGVEVIEVGEADKEEAAAGMEIRQSYAIISSRANVLVAILAGPLLL